MRVDESNPKGPQAELDLEGQLDALLEQIDQAEPEAAPGEASSAEAADTSDALGLDLASQIQQLLDDARTQQPGSESPTVPSSAAEVNMQPAPLPEAESFDEQQMGEDAFVAPQAILPPESTPESTPEPTPEPAPAAMPKPQPPVDAAEPVSIQAIDQMLADEADEALAGDFETIGEVLSTQQSPPPPAPETSPKASSEASPASSAPASSSEAGQAQADMDDMDFEGAFETPQVVEAGASQQSALSADAQAVARELDEQPELRARQGKAGVDSADIPLPPADHRPSLLHVAMAQASTFPELLRSLCATINKPLASITPQSRDMVGYAGLITLFWGSVTLVGKLVWVLMG